MCIILGQLMNSFPDVQFQTSDEADILMCRIIRSWADSLMCRNIRSWADSLLDRCHQRNWHLAAQQKRLLRPGTIYRLCKLSDTGGRRLRKLPPFANDPASPFSAAERQSCCCPIEMPQPDLPTLPHSDIDLILSRRFGREPVNYFSGTYQPTQTAARSSPIIFRRFSIKSAVFPTQQ